MRPIQSCVIGCVFFAIHAAGCSVGVATFQPAEERVGTAAHALAGADEERLPNEGDADDETPDTRDTVGEEFDAPPAAEVEDPDPEPWHGGASDVVDSSPKRHP